MMEPGNVLQPVSDGCVGGGEGSWPYNKPLPLMDSGGGPQGVGSQCKQKIVCVGTRVLFPLSSVVRQVTQMRGAAGDAPWRGSTSPACRQARPSPLPGKARNLEFYMKSGF